jgi:hypothetical protein
VKKETQKLTCIVADTVVELANVRNNKLVYWSSNGKYYMTSSIMQERQIFMQEKNGYIRAGTTRCQW